MRTRRQLLSGLNIGLFAVLLIPPTEAVAVCDTPPECQCACLSEWDKCAEGRSTEEAREDCDPEYNECYEENCFS